MGLRSTCVVLCLVAVAVAATACSETDEEPASCYTPPLPCGCGDGSMGTQSCIPGQPALYCRCDTLDLGVAGAPAPAPVQQPGQQSQGMPPEGGNTMMGEAMATEGMQGDGTQPDPTNDEGTSEPVVSDDPSVPGGGHCQPTAGWDGAWAQWEHEVLLLVNEERAVGGNCGGQAFGPSGPMTTNANLRCAARLHSKDMSDRSYFAHNNPDGLDPFARIGNAGYSGGTMGENIAMGQPSPGEVVQGWMNSPGHCSNILNDGFTEIGVGYYRGPDSGWTPGHYWTQNFGGPGGGWF